MAEQAPEKLPTTHAYLSIEDKTRVAYGEVYSHNFRRRQDALHELERMVMVQYKWDSEPLLLDIQALIAKWRPSFEARMK